MSFIRIKKRILSGKEVSYAYLVKNRWDKKAGLPKQSVSKYLGRVIELKDRIDKDFISYAKAKDFATYAADNSRARIITDLANWELSCHGFGGTAGKAGVVHDEKNIVVRLNEGYMCTYTLGRLYSFKTEEEDPHFAGILLATRFSEAGIKIPKELFVVIYEKFAGVVY